MSYHQSPASHETDHVSSWIRTTSAAATRESIELDCETKAGADDTCARMVTVRKSNRERRGIAGSETRGIGAQWSEVASSLAEAPTVLRDRGGDVVGRLEGWWKIEEVGEHSARRASGKTRDRERNRERERERERGKRVALKGEKEGKG